jgi:hypothetical protein
MIRFCQDPISAICGSKEPWWVHVIALAAIPICGAGIACSAATAAYSDEPVIKVSMALASAVCGVSGVAIESMWVYLVLAEMSDQ